MSERPAFTLVMQGITEPKVTLFSDFVAVRIAGEGDGAEIFVSNAVEAQAFIDAFTEARDHLAPPPEYDPDDAEAQRIAETCADANREYDRIENEDRGERDRDGVQ